MKTKSYILIEGITESGKEFRPSNWAERLAENLATFGIRHHIKYSQYVQPAVYKGHAALEVDPELRHVNPSAFEQLMAFARDNQLVICDECRV